MNNIKTRQWGPINRKVVNEDIDFLHFCNMPNKISGKYSKEWAIIKNCLLELDKN